MKSSLLFSILIFFGLSFDRLNIFKITILSSVAHEIGHIAACRFFTKKWPGVKASVFGFTIYNNVSLNKYYRIILFSGPLINLIICCIALLFLNRQLTVFNMVVFSVNIIIFVFNMLPVYFLDGGQLLYSISRTYQLYYKEVSGLTVLILSVMVFSFTGEIGLLSVFMLYFIINMINDV